MRIVVVGAVEFSRHCLKEVLWYGVLPTVFLIELVAALC